MSQESHNRIVPEVLKALIRESDGEADAMVMLESLILGFMLYFRPDPRHAAEYLDMMTPQVLERMRNAPRKD